MKLSVILPVYGVENYIRECIESLLIWKEPEVEYLFVDDGSKDHSADIVKEYADKDSRVVLLSKENGGCASARQFGLEHAKGEYIGFVDPDDVICPDMFQKLYEKAKESDYDFVYCGFQKFDDKTGTSEKVKENLSEVFVRGTKDQEQIAKLMTEIEHAVWRGIFSRKFLENNKISYHTDLCMFDDLPFLLKVISRARSVACVPEYLYQYRVSRLGQDSGATDERLFVTIKLYEYLDAWLETKGTELQKKQVFLSRVRSHKYVLGRIDEALLKEYLIRASADVKKEYAYKGYGSFWENLFATAIQRNDLFFMKTFRRFRKMKYSLKR